MWRRTFGRQKVLPRTPFQKTFFRRGRWSPPLDGGERTTARGPGKQKEEGIVAFLFLFWVRMACLACAAYLYGCPVQNKNAEGRVPSAFYVMSAVLFVRDPYLSWPLLPGDRQWGLSGVVPGSPSSCIKRVGGRMGAWGKEGPLRASRRPKAAAAVPVVTKGATGIDSRARSLLPPKKLAYMWKKRRGGTPGIMRASASLR